eukprot:9626292-Ditylum_brightwellii.AAC.1
MDNMPKGLKITNRAGIILFDSASIAGVEYDKDLFDDNDYTPDSDDSTNMDKTSHRDDSTDMDEMDANELADILDE